MINKTVQRGFTLIEVLVALIIIAIACFAVLHIVASSINMNSRLEHHMVGTWISDNVITDLQVKAVNFSADTDSVDGQTKMLFQQWPWTATKQKQDSFIGQYEQGVGVTVKAATPPHADIWHLQGYIPLSTGGNNG